MRSHTNTVLIFLVLVAGVACPQSPPAISVPAIAPQVKPVFPQEKTSTSQPPDAASLAGAKANKTRWEAQQEEQRKLAHETYLRGYWIDPVTGLMWAGHDNGEAVTWHKADSYCKKLRLAGYSDWRLATLDELATLVEKADSPDHSAQGESFTLNLGLRVRGGLLLSGNPWSSTREKNRFGKPYGDGWFFDFIHSKPSGDLPYFRNTKYALCVRSTGH